MPPRVDLLPAPVPEDEASRLREVRAVTGADVDWGQQFEDLAEAARQLLDAPMAAVTIVEEDRQVFEVAHGLGDLEATAREDSFCAHALESEDVFVVPDAEADPRFRDNPYVAGDPGIRFYAGAPIRPGDTSGLGTLCVLDTTPREIDEDQREALRALGRHVSRDVAEEGRRQVGDAAFAAFVAHELRDPLTGIAGSLDLLEASVGLDLGPEARETLRKAMDEARRLEEQLDALLAFAAGADEDAFAPVDLDAVVDDVADALDDGDATIRAGSLPTVVGHEVLLHQLFENLVDNALRHQDGPPVVDVACTPTDTGWQFSVEDQGPGFDPEAEDVFEIFERGDATAEGDGVGLALCKLVVRRHGGEIWVDDDGKGGRIAFTLPESLDEG